MACLISTEAWNFQVSRMAWLFCFQLWCRERMRRAQSWKIRGSQGTKRQNTINLRLKYWIDPSWEWDACVDMRNEKYWSMSKREEFQVVWKRLEKSKHLHRILADIQPLAEWEQHASVNDIPTCNYTCVDSYLHQPNIHASSLPLTPSAGVTLTSWSLSAALLIQNDVLELLLHHVLTLVHWQMWPILIEKDHGHHWLERLDVQHWDITIISLWLENLEWIQSHFLLPLQISSWEAYSLHPPSQPTSCRMKNQQIPHRYVQARSPCRTSTALCHVLGAGFHCGAQLFTNERICSKHCLRRGLDLTWLSVDLRFMKTCSWYNTSDCVTVQLYEFVPA